MRYLLLALLISMAQPGFAQLYKCTNGEKIAYQDKPCATSQNQTVIVIQPIQTISPSPESGSTSEQGKTVIRDANGKIKRSQQAKNAFKAAHPCPANAKRSGACPGYVIDHIKPLACGGADNPENMQWQTIQEGKEKDSWERKDC